MSRILRLHVYDWRSLSMVVPLFGCRPYPWVVYWLLMDVDGCTWFPEMDIGGNDSTYHDRT